MKKVTELEHGLIQVYFYSLPIGATFLHKGNFYEKIEEEKVKEVCDKEWVMEGQYGCLISEKQFDQYGLKSSNIREDNQDMFAC